MDLRKRKHKESLYSQYKINQKGGNGKFILYRISKTKFKGKPFSIWC